MRSRAKANNGHSVPANHEQVPDDAGMGALAPRGEVLLKLKRFSVLTREQPHKRPPLFHGKWSISQATKAKVFWELQYTSLQSNYVYGGRRRTD